MRFIKTLIALFVAGVLLSGCYAYGGGYYHGQSNVVLCSDYHQHSVLSPHDRMWIMHNQWYNHRGVVECYNSRFKTHIRVPCLPHPYCD